MSSDDEQSGNTAGTGNSGAAPKAVKLPYFHRTLSPQDTALIGDTTPKPIAASTASSSKSESVSGKINESSAWNSANTWEERDFTSQAKAKLIEAFGDEDSTSLGVSVRKIEKIEGHASITHVRGRARYMYEWSFSLEFTDSATGASGTVSVSDVMNDQLDDIELEVKWKPSAPTAKDAAKSVKAGLKAEIVRRVKKFEDAYRSL